MTEKKFKKKSESFLMWYAVIVSVIGLTAIVLILFQSLGEVCQ